MCTIVDFGSRGGAEPQTSATRLSTDPSSSKTKIFFYLHK
jgi:hypothetical protein